MTQQQRLLRQAHNSFQRSQTHTSRTTKMSEAKDNQPNASSTALARKRRKELRAKSRPSEVDSDEPEEISSSSSEKHPKPSLRGIKIQARYDPGVPMNREQLKAWRKEARRVRNRESAAESRKRTRDRIDELESQVDVLQSKYSAALERIVELEAAAAAGVHDAAATVPLTKPQDAGMVVSPTISPQLSPMAIAPLSPHSGFTLSPDGHRTQEEEVDSTYQHIKMISRHQA